MHAKNMRFDYLQTIINNFQTDFKYCFVSNRIEKVIKKGDKVINKF